MAQQLEAVDGIEIVTLVDNYVDLLLRARQGVKRPPKAVNGRIPGDTLLAEHGLSLLVRVAAGQHHDELLFDTGYSQVALFHNAARLGVDLGAVENVVLSHGHMDHTGSLGPLGARLPEGTPLVLHPDVFLSPRYVTLDDGQRLQYPDNPAREILESRGFRVKVREEPTLVAGGRVLVTGSVPRVTGFEKGMPNALCEREGVEEKDRILDDQSLVVHLRDHGLVIISGCSHAGIINTLHYARACTGVERIYAVMGGLHLSGPEFERIIPPTLEALREMSPQWVVPMHCTGWEAIHALSRAFPEGFVLNSVGTTIQLPVER